jgi:hypothetical protein
VLWIFYPDLLAVPYPDDGPPVDRTYVVERRRVKRIRMNKSTSRTYFVVSWGSRRLIYTYIEDDYDLMIYIYIYICGRLIT